MAKMNKGMEANVNIRYRLERQREVCEERTCGDQSTKKNAIFGVKNAN
jgi:hypothetical protein